MSNISEFKVILQVVQAPSLPEAEASFAVQGDGVADFKD